MARRGFSLEADIQPTVDESAAESEAQDMRGTFEDELGDLQVGVDDSGLGGLGGARGGGGGGMGGAAAGAAAGRGGGALKGMMGGGAASAALPVALAGATAFGILKGVQGLAQHSPALSQTLGLIGEAMSLFFRPFGNFLSESLRPMAEGMLTMSTNFNDVVDSEGLAVGIAWLGGSVAEEFTEAFGGSIEDLLSGEADITDLLTITGTIGIGSYLAGSVSITSFITGSVGASSLISGTAAASTLIGGTILIGALVVGNIKMIDYIKGEVRAGNLITGTVAATSLIAGNILIGSYVAGSIGISSYIGGSVAAGALIGGSVSASTLIVGTIAIGAFVVGTIILSEYVTGKIMASDIIDTGDHTSGGLVDSPDEDATNPAYDGQNTDTTEIVDIGPGSGYSAPTPPDTDEIDYSELDLPGDETDPDPEPDRGGTTSPIRGSHAGLAQGGVARRRTTATIGEAGPEAVMPLDDLGRMLSRAVRQAVRGANTGGGNSGMGDAAASELRTLVREMRKTRKAIEGLDTGGQDADAGAELDPF